MKPDMGILIIRSRFGDKCYIEATRDLKGTINRNRFQLGAGSHPSQELQTEWKEHGAGCFTIEVIDTLEYDKDQSKTNYSEDLALLQMIWEEKLVKENMEFYKG